VLGLKQDIGGKGFFFETNITGTGGYLVVSCKLSKGCHTHSNSTYPGEEAG
jgi:hypothetical protein